jgi:D-sedoheptulose 7-phosphate isomerase
MYRRFAFHTNCYIDYVFESKLHQLPMTTPMTSTSHLVDILQTNVAQSIQAKEALLKDARLLETFSKATAHVIECYKAGGRLYIAGNGGSAADSQHLAAEFVSKLARDRNPLPAESLTTDTSILTAIGNDYGYEHVFSRQLIAKLKPNDVFLGITTSGRSKNILSALQVCKEVGVKSIVFTGFGGGAAATLATGPAPSRSCTFCWRTACAKRSNWRSSLSRRSDPRRDALAKSCRHAQKTWSGCKIHPQSPANMGSGGADEKRFTGTRPCCTITQHHISPAYV